MNIKPDWNVFKANFSENPEKNFEWMCYQLFCRKFGCDSGLFRFYNHPALEAEPIHEGSDWIGFQAKFYDNILSKEKQRIKNAVQEVKSKYPKLTILYFYAHQDWTSKSNDREIKTQEETEDFDLQEGDKRTKAQKEIEDFALQEGLHIEWKTQSHFESPFVTIDNSDIAQYFFDIDTNDYYKKILGFQILDTALLGEEAFETSLYVNDSSHCLFGKNVLSDFILDQLKNKDLADFSDIYIRGVAGIGKSTEMRIAYNNLIKKCSHTDCYHDFRFLPTPYFYELKAYQEGCFKIAEKEKPILFLDGMDEIPNSKVISFINELLNLKSQNPSVKFIIAGRDASFPDGLNASKHISVRLSFHIDDDLQNLINKFKGTVFESFVGIPFYRTLFSSDDFKNIKTYKDIIERLIISRLEDDNKKKGVETDSLYSEREIDTNELIKKLASFSFSLFSSGERIFSDQILLNWFDKKETIYLLRSCLFDYKNSSNISFFSVIYFEYFVALYFSSQKYAFIEKKLFTSTGKAITQYINILSILLNLIPNNEKKYIKLANKLKKETSAYILLTDYVTLSKTARFEFYNAIINECNADKKVIYYYRFTKTDDILANIDSLADSMHNLLPEDFYNEAVKEHCDVIKKFLKDPTTDELVPFENAVILLGVRNSNWTSEQQEMLKGIAAPLLKFFLDDDLTEKMEGLLSERIVLRWYENYKWTENWKEKEWISFVKELTSVENTDFYNFKDEKEYSFKLKLFIHFHNNPFIQKLLIPLAKKILTSTSPTAIASCVPNIIDDNFKTQTVDFNYDIILFTDVFKKSDVSLSDVLQILQIYPVKYSAIPIEAHDLYREVLEAFERKIPDIKEENIPEFYGALVNYIETDSGTYLYDFNKYIKLLNDDQKEKVFDLLFSDLMKKTDWQNIWMLPNNIIVPLLDMVDKQRAISLFEKLRDMKSIYQNCINNLDREENKGHPLHDMATVEYLELFADRVEVEKKLKERLDAFNAEKIPVQEKEFDVITNKDNAFVNEVEHIFEYIDKHPDFSESKDILGKLYDLQLDRIEQNLKFDHNGEYVKPDIFSPFAIDFLIHNNEDDLKSNHEIIEIINDWFADEKYFWRYFFWIYICYRKAEEVDKFLNKYPWLTDRIKESIQLELSHCLEDDISMYDGGQNCFWVVPFVYYLERLYDNKLPDWFDKDKILNFVAYPARDLSTHEYIHVNFEFKWKDWRSVFEWIEEIAGIDEDNIIKYALYLLPKLKSRESKVQILSIFVKMVKSESMYKQQMIDRIIDNTVIEIQKEYNDYGVLSSFWLETTENYVERLYSYINFEKYNLEDKNSCRTAVLEYFCNVATYEQKAKVIETLKNSMDKPNIKIYLAKLGYKKAILAIIDGFLNGDDWNRIWNSSELFMNSTKSFKLLHKCCKLYSYSLEKNCERRELLTGLAKRGIKQNATKWNFWYIRCRLNKEIKKLKKNSLYYEHIQDFLNEIEQKVFSPKQGDDK